VKTGNRWIAILVAVAGMGVCLVALVGFVLTVLRNNLPWHQAQSVRDYYQAVGDSYSQGFTVGFFLCFFMTMIAVTISTLFDRRAKSTLQAGGSPVESRSRPSC
jgi:hypothetical protein